MASVFRAYEPALDRYVALKVLPAESVRDEASAERFKREARVIARLEHPNITPIHGFGIDDATQIPWMAMRLISGGTFASRLTMKITPARAVGILRGVADALDYAHAKGVMHRDVKPANILLDEAGRVYLADFGIARLVEGATQLTAAGLISGTPAYMAPEQATGVNLDHRVDVYALGVVAYEALAGRVPFTSENPIDVLMKHVQAPVPEIPDLPPPVMEAVRKALAKDPADRWESAGALVTALEAAIAASMPDERPHPTPAPMPAMPSTAAGPGPTAHAGPRATAVGGPRTQAAPTRVAAVVEEDLPTLAAPSGRPAAVAAAPGRAWGPGLIAVIVGAVGLVGLAVAGGLYLVMAPTTPPAAEPVPSPAGVVAVAPATLPPAVVPWPREPAAAEPTPDAQPLATTPARRPPEPAAAPRVAPPVAAVAPPATTFAPRPCSRHYGST
jgi:serine/threonine-protein kinase